MYLYNTLTIKGRLQAKTKIFLCIFLFLFSELYRPKLQIKPKYKNRECREKTNIC